MKKPKFSLGHWSIVNYKGNIYIGAGLEHDCIGQIWNHADGQQDGLANAHLVAAAPDLYAALEDAVSIIDYYECKYSKNKKEGYSQSLNLQHMHEILALARGEL